MYDLQVRFHEGLVVTDSRDVARLVGKNHKELLRTIDKYCGHLSEDNSLSAKLRSIETDAFTSKAEAVESVSSGIKVTDFFIKTSYLDSIGRTLPCYLLTKKGCDLVANKMTGKKGVMFTATYVERFHEMEMHLANTVAPLLEKQAAVMIDQMKMCASINTSALMSVTADAMEEIKKLKGTVSRLKTKVANQQSRIDAPPTRRNKKEHVFRSPYPLQPAPFSPEIESQIKAWQAMMKKK